MIDLDCGAPESRARLLVPVVQRFVPTSLRAAPSAGDAAGVLRFQRTAGWQAESKKAVYLNVAYLPASPDNDPR